MGHSTVKNPDSFAQTDTVNTTVFVMLFHLASEANEKQTQIQPMEKFLYLNLKLNDTLNTKLYSGLITFLQSNFSAKSKKVQRQL